MFDKLGCIATHVPRRRVLIWHAGYKLAAAVREKEKVNAYKNIATAPEWHAMTDDLYTVAHDKHLHVYLSLAPLPQGPSASPPPQVPNELRWMNGGIIEARILDGDVGYMKLYAVLPLELAHGAVAAPCIVRVVLSLLAGLLALRWLSRWLQHARRHIFPAYCPLASVAAW